jgi:uncharacterized protein YggU (UPF0235/DUF167 family)
LLRVRVQPRAPRSEIVGWRADGTLGVRVAAPPVDALGLRASAVTIAHGARGRDKLVRVNGLTPAEIRRRLDGGRT